MKKITIIFILCLLPSITLAASGLIRTDGQGTLSIQQKDTNPVPTTIAPILPTKDLLPPPNDCRIFKKKYSTMAAPMLNAPPYGGDFYDTSSYMAGKVAVGIILPESSGSAENWTQDEVAEVISKIKTAMDWWASIEPNANLSFYYDIHTPFDGTQSVKINSEPIQISYERTWINQVMTVMGWTNPGPKTAEDYFYRVFDYNNYIRDMLETHWAFTIFVVDSSKDLDGVFPDDDMFAYAYLGGPFMVMTYDNGDYDIENMDSCCAHEMGHIFYALDEYIGASSKTEQSGYLNVINGNHASVPESVPCIMKGLISPFANHQVCQYTRGQLGLWDTDLDNILDVIDSPPNVSLTPYSPFPTSTQTPTYYGSAIVTAVPNKNPQEVEPRHAITINTISQVEYKIDNGSWLSAQAVDGSFDEPEEDFTFTPSTLSDGTYTFVVKAIDSAGNISNYATDTLNIKAYNLEVLPLEINIKVREEYHLSAQIYDKSGQKIPDMEYRWNVLSGMGTLSQAIGATNTFIAGSKSGTETIIVTCASITATVIVIITPGELHHLVVTPSPSTIEVGTEMRFMVIGYDKYNNPIPELSCNWQTPSPLGQLTTSVGSSTIFRAGIRPGTLTINALMGTITGYATVTIIPGILHHLVVEPAMAVIQVQSQQVFYARGYDQYDNYLPQILFNWTIEDELGALSSSYGTKTTLTAGRFIINGRITASNNGVSNYATVTITPGELGYFQFDSIANQQAGDEFPITITAMDKDKNIINNYTESVTLSDTTNTIKPQIADNFRNGVWTGIVQIMEVASDITIKAEEKNGKIGISNKFSVLPKRMVVYPVPFRQSIGDTHIIFKGLTEDAAIIIYDLSGDIIREQDHVSTVWRWDIINENIPSGVYFFVVTEEGKGRRMGKMVIIR